MAATTPDARFLEALGNNMAMINGHFELPPETIEAMKKIRQAVDECAFKIKVATVDAGVKYDAGAMIGMVQQLQAVKNKACDAVILPHGAGAAVFSAGGQAQ